MHAHGHQLRSPSDEVREIVFHVYHVGGASRWVSRNELGDPRGVTAPLRGAIEAGYLDSTKDQSGVPLLTLTSDGLALVEIDE